MQRLLRNAWRGWKRIARRIGEVQARAVLTLLYFVLFAPLSLVARSKDPLDLRRRAGWRPYQGRSADVSLARRQ